MKSMHGNGTDRSSAGSSTPPSDTDSSDSYKSGSDCGDKHNCDLRARPLIAATLNVTGLWERRRHLPAWTHDALCLQDTGLSSKRVAVVQKQLKFAGIQCQSSVYRGEACCSDLGTAGGGCAILSRFPLADVELPLEKLMASTARFCDAWILLPEGRRVFVASIYGVDSGKPDHSARNSAFFAAILRR